MIDVLGCLVVFGCAVGLVYDRLLWCLCLWAYLRIVSVGLLFKLALLKLGLLLPAAGVWFCGFTCLVCLIACLGRLF